MGGKDASAAQESKRGSHRQRRAARATVAPSAAALCHGCGTALLPGRSARVLEAWQSLQDAAISMFELERRWPRAGPQAGVPSCRAPGAGVRAPPCRAPETCQNEHHRWKRA
jgi:hypothetical protein